MPGRGSGRLRRRDDADFQEAIDSVHGKAGMYPELKDPEFYRKRSIRTDVLLAAALKRTG